MTRSRPCAPARTSARSCVRRISGWASPRRRPRSRWSPAPPLGAAQPELALVEVEGPDGDRLRRDLLDQAAVERVLRVFGRAGQRAARQHELGPIEADALGAVLAQQLQILEQLDVRLQPDATPSAVAGRLAPAASRPAPTRLRRRGRAARRCARSMASAIGLDRAARRSRRRGSPACPAGIRAEASCRPTTAGHLQRAREDGGVVRAAAGVDGKALDARPVELRRERRGQLVGDEDPTGRRARSAGRAAPRAP